MPEGSRRDDSYDRGRIGCRIGRRIGEEWSKQSGEGNRGASVVRPEWVQSSTAPRTEPGIWRWCSRGDVKRHVDLREPLQTPLVVIGEVADSFGSPVQWPPTGRMPLCRGVPSRANESASLLTNDVGGPSAYPPWTCRRTATCQRRGNRAEQG